MGIGKLLCIVCALSVFSGACGMAEKKDTDKRNMTETASRYSESDQAASMCAKEPMAADGIVRLSEIEVYPQYLEEYVKYAVEVGEISLRTESGVLTMYAVCEKENPCMITILETYASREAYDKHIASEHFRKYKQGTLHMVKRLTLTDQTPLNPANAIHNFIR